jgi:predicted hydrolase (HD superfamily)
MRATRAEAWETLTEYTKSEALLRHALAVEASVGFYARLYGEDEDFWRATALLHDFDYEIHPTSIRRTAPRSCASSGTRMS